MFFYNKTVPVAKSLALVDNLKGSLSSGILRIRAMIKVFSVPQKYFVA